jgi:septal ring factor EnvC (AmiA/AmiB activator)
VKKRIAFTIAVALVFTLFAGSIAMASPAGPPPDVLAKKAAREATRQAFLAEIKPLRDEIAANREELKVLRKQLETLRLQIEAQLEALRANPTGLSAEQIAQIQAISEQIKTVRQTFNASNTEMKQEKNSLGGAKKLGMYEALKKAYNNIIRVQHLRIEVLKSLIALSTQLLTVLNPVPLLPSPSPAA